MQTEIEKLELALRIKKENLNWEYSYLGGARWDDGDDNNRLYGILSDKGYSIHIKPLEFPEPPAGAKWHNPKGLTVDEVGKGKRLALYGEILPKGYEFYSQSDEKWVDNDVFRGEKIGVDCNYNTTVRVPIDTPFNMGKIPLGPEDMTADIQFRMKGWGKSEYVTPLRVSCNGIYFIVSGTTISFAIWDLLQKDGVYRHGNKDFWKPCEKDAK